MTKIVSSSILICSNASCLLPEKFKTVKGKTYEIEPICSLHRLKRYATFNELTSQ